MPSPSAPFQLYQIDKSLRERNLVRKVNEVPEPIDCDSCNQSLAALCQRGLIEMQHHVSPLIFGCVHRSVLHVILEYFGAEASGSSWGYKKMNSDGKILAIVFNGTVSMGS
jgi:hypothetical protein